MTRHRPIGITILAILAGIATLIAALHTLQFAHILPFMFGPLVFFSFDLLGALLWALMTFIYAWVTVQLWNVNPQGWMFLVLLAVLNIVLDLISVLGQSTFQAVLPSIIINAIVLLYCLMPGVRAAFGQEAPQAA
ncbi:MAG TPA: hypothetical protein VGJ75_26080 [Dongiaceae bacterium]|jgi:hypothetical protein